MSYPGDWGWPAIFLINIPIGAILLLIAVATTLCSIPAFAAILLTQGALQIASMLCFGFFLWASFSVTIAMAHELMPSRIGLISGLFMGIAMGAGGLGVSVSGAIADHFGLTATLTLADFINDIYAPVLRG